MSPKGRRPETEKENKLSDVPSWTRSPHALTSKQTGWKRRAMTTLEWNGQWEYDVVANTKLNLCGSCGREFVVGFIELETRRPVFALILLHLSQQAGMKNVTLQINNEENDPFCTQKAHSHVWMWERGLEEVSTVTLMCDDAGTAADLLERFIRTTYPLSLFTCFSSKHTLACLVTVEIVSDTGRAGQGLWAF